MEQNGIGGRMKSKKAAGGKCTTKSKSKYSSCGSGSGKGGKAAGTIASVAALGGIAALAYKVLKK